MRNWQNKIPPVPSPDGDGVVLGVDVANSPNTGYFARYLTNGNPFDTQQEDEEKEDVFSGSGVRVNLLECLHGGPTELFLVPASAPQLV